LYLVEGEMWRKKQPAKLLKLVIKFAMKSLHQNIKVSNTVVME